MWKSHKKLLFIGIDGVRTDCLLVSGENFRSIIQEEHVKYSTHCEVFSTTMSGPSWSTILSGKDQHTHSVFKNSTVEDEEYECDYQTFLSSLCKLNYNVSTIISSWNGINNIVKRSSNKNYFCATFNDDSHNDTEACNIAIDILNEEKHDIPDVIFLYLSNADTAGHTHGFGLHCKGYLDSIIEIDRCIGNVLTTLHTRKNKFANEDWLIVLTTDHGGTDWNCMSNEMKEDFTQIHSSSLRKGIHGLDIKSHKSNWLVCINDKFEKGEILPSPNTKDVFTIVESHFQENLER